MKKLAILCLMGAMMTMTACGDDKDDCTKDAVTCSAAGVPQKCVKGKWVDQAACDAATQVCKDGVCSAKPVTDSCDAAACKAKTGADYKGNACIGNAGAKVCGCASVNDCNDSANSECKSGVCVAKGNTDTCSVNACKVKTGADYKGNACIGDEGSKHCGCETANDCNDPAGYNCTGGECVAKGNTDTCVASDCAAKTGAEYKGNACIGDAGSKHCGCGSVSDCPDSTNWDCTSGECKSKGNTDTCVASDCAAKTGAEYKGNACIGDEGSKYCGCVTPSDCKDSENAGCMSGECVWRDTCVASDCAAKTGADYKGNACIGEVGSKHCGCALVSDCPNSTNYECTGGECVAKAPGGCNAEACANATGEDYLGNACISVGGKQICGCNTASDCNGQDDECVGGICMTGFCNGKNNTTYCHGNILVECEYDSVDRSYNCANENEGHACVTDSSNGEHCGCNSVDDCPEGFSCNTSWHYCEEDLTACTSAKCKEQFTSDKDHYFGDVCVDGYGSTKSCGCVHPDDCQSGYVCDTTYQQCTKNDSCNKSECETDIVGTACVAISGSVQCGCYSDDDCEDDAYTKCNTTTKQCTTP